MRKSKKQLALKKIGRIISEHRIKNGYSRTALALEINSDEKHIRRIENGEVNTTIISLLKLFHVLKINPEVLNKIKIDKSFYYD